MSPRDPSRRSPVTLSAALVCACHVLAPAFARAEPSRTPNDPHLAVSRWGTGEGLPQSSVTDLAQTRDGYLWITTFGGIARFDGVRFAVFGMADTPALPGNRWLSVHEDVHGTLWFGAQEHGLVRFRDHRFEALSAPPDIAHASVLGLASDARGTVWAATSVGLVVVRGDDVTRVPTPLDDLSPLTGVLIAGDHAWLSAPAGPACVGATCPRIPALAPHLLGHPDWDLTFDEGAMAANGELWFGTRSGLWRLPPAGAALASEYPLPDLDGPPLMRRIALDEDGGRVWFAADRRLFMRSRPEPRAPPRWSEHTALLGDEPDTIRTLLVDREGGLWIGTDRSGLLRVRLDATSFARVDRPEGIDVPTVAILEDRDGQRWATGYCSGLFRGEAGGAFARDPLGADRARCIRALAVAPDGALWASDHGRLLRRHDGAWREHPFMPSEPKPANALAFDGQGTLWVGTEGHGLAEVDAHAPAGIAVRRVWSAKDGLGGDTVVAVVPTPDGGLWLGTNQGAARLAPDRTFARWTANEGLARGTVRDILPLADGTTWVGTYGGGLSRIRGGAVSTFSSANGLCDNTVSRILADGAGGFWMNGNRGVSHVLIANLEEVARGSGTEVECALIDSGEGNGGVQPAGWHGADGRLWFPTVRGVVSLDPRTALMRMVPPLAVIETVAIDGAKLALGPAAVIAPPGRGDVTFHVTGIAFDAPAQIRFRHRLIGWESDWIDDGTYRTVAYTNLPPGDYTFEVRARSLRGAWSEPARIALALEPHLWETTWFRVVAGAGLIALAWALVRWRLRGVAQRNRALQAEVLERQQAEQRARQEERHYRTLFESTTNGLFLHDATGRLLEANRAACDLLGLERAALLAGGLGQVMTPDVWQAYRGLVAACAAGDKPEAIEVTVVRAGAGATKLELRIQAARFDESGTGRALCAAVDLTAVHRAEAQRAEYEQRMQHGQKLEAIGLLAGGVAHDFNNHLAAIRASNDALRDDASSADDRAASVEHIEHSVERAAELVKKLLSFARQEPGSTKDIDAEHVVQALFPFLRRLIGASIELSYMRDGACGTVSVDPVLFEQALINLVVNARDAMPRGGTITLVTGRTTLDADEAARQRVGAGDYAVVSVRDTGEGIGDADRARVFDPFFTTKEVGKGTGLGLSIVHAFVARTHGFITLDSAPQSGTTFRLHLPIVQRPETVRTGPTERPAPERARRGAQILVCEDDPLVRPALKRMLELRGFAVTVAETPAVALEHVTRDPQSVDLLLTDVVLPGFSGVELARRARTIRAELPVVLMSGHTRDALGEDGADHHGLVLLQKPFASDVLARAVASALDGEG